MKKLSCGWCQWERFVNRPLDILHTYPLWATIDEGSEDIVRMPLDEGMTALLDKKLTMMYAVQYPLSMEGRAENLQTLPPTMVELSGLIAALCFTRSLSKVFSAVPVFPCRPRQMR